MKQAMVFLLFLLCPTSFPQAPRPNVVFRSMEGFMSLPDDARREYAMGFLDGLGMASGMGAPDGPVFALAACVRGMTGTQLAAIFVKYGKEHPEKWNQPFALEAFNALHSSACPQFGVWVRRVNTQ